ncbi:MAG: phosphohistidine phosphatase SixA [Psychromonas sp.]
MKTIYFVQHGLANTREIDLKRGLSDIGSEQTSKVATYLQHHKIVINKICHSGKLRASQTAAIFSDVLSIPNVCELNCILPNEAPEELIKQINSDAVMYIGHLPNLQKVLNLLLCQNIDNKVLSLQNSAVACVEIEDTTASLKWFITAEMS